jgi:hypothetical protein
MGVVHWRFVDFYESYWMLLLYLMMTCFVRNGVDVELEFDDELEDLDLIGKFIVVKKFD